MIVPMKQITSWVGEGEGEGEVRGGGSGRFKSL